MDISKYCWITSRINLIRMHRCVCEDGRRREHCLDEDEMESRIRSFEACHLRPRHQHHPSRRKIKMKWQIPLRKKRIMYPQAHSDHSCTKKYTTVSSAISNNNEDDARSVHRHGIHSNHGTSYNRSTSGDTVAQSLNHPASRRCIGVSSTCP